MWHVSSRSGEACCELLYSVFLYRYLIHWTKDGIFAPAGHRPMPPAMRPVSAISVATVQPGCAVFRYVSDQAFDGYKSYCQQKLVDGSQWVSVMARMYPPSLLEWTAAASRLPLALTALFADGPLSANCFINCR